MSPGHGASFESDDFERDETVRDVCRRLHFVSLCDVCGQFTEFGVPTRVMKLALQSLAPLFCLLLAGAGPETTPDSVTLQPERGGGRGTGRGTVREYTGRSLEIIIGTGRLQTYSASEVIAVESPQTE